MVAAEPVIRTETGSVAVLTMPTSNIPSSDRPVGPQQRAMHPFPKA